MYYVYLHPHVHCHTSMYCFHNRICFERKQRLYPGDMYLVMDAPCYYMYCIGLDSYMYRVIVNTVSTLLCYTDWIYDVTSGVGIRLGNKNFI